jgi:hypothetical protein
MLGFAIGEFALGEFPAAETSFTSLLRAPVARRVFLVEIYPYAF